MKRALITGITGQDGAYLAKLLIEKGYNVYGTVRRSTSEKFVNLKYLNIYDKIKFYDFDLLELSNIQNVIKETKPHEIYHLAAQSFVPTSFQVPIVTTDINSLGTLILCALYGLYCLIIHFRIILSLHIQQNLQEIANKILTRQILQRL